MKKVQIFTLITATALATLLAIPGSAAPDVSTRPTAAAAGGPGRAAAGPVGGMRGRMENRLEKLDTNDDDKISRDEFLAPQLAHIDALFKRRDINGDGLIAEGEGKPQRPAANTTQAPRQMGPARPQAPQLDRAALVACIQQAVPGFTPPSDNNDDDHADRFDATDTNNDGKLSINEVTTSMTAHATERFNDLDTNHDGFISTAETTARQQAQAKIATATFSCMLAQRGK